MEKQFNLFLICFLINILFSTQNPLAFDVEINPNISTDAAGFFINDKTDQKFCPNWFPSLFVPILLISNDRPIGDTTPLLDLDFQLNIPFFNKNRKFQGKIYNQIQFLENKFQSILIRPETSDIKHCYFGIGYGVKNYTTLKEKDTILSLFFNQSLHKIFSFSKWDLSPNLNTTFYLGESHSDFISNKGIIGSCKIDTDDDLWGCFFKEMKFNNLNIPLNKSDGNLYKIYFATETHNLFFPTIYRDIFKTISNDVCYANNNNYLSCQGFFNNSTYVKLQLTEFNGNFKITGQVDNVNRFNQIDDDKNDYARIQFENIEYIILPLMAFKDFHVQFNAEDNEIRFYTEDASILEVNDVKKEEPSESSSAWIIILIILIIIGLGLGIFWFLRNRKNNEKNINQFSKFEDEEDYKNMNEKKVF